ncbi:unnamed protein product [Owenia fusiformis]|uniref:SH2 domain-containing protein n=1 Tax=Owenia fusiformis TaxID=6347 RepID=A0A8S4Q654_OWEFU|nr:unnamed protein product [Owenia fusiformis]
MKLSEFLDLEVKAPVDDVEKGQKCNSPPTHVHVNWNRQAFHKRKYGDRLSHHGEVGMTPAVNLEQLVPVNCESPKQREKDDVYANIRISLKRNRLHDKQAPPRRHTSKKPTPVIPAKQYSQPNIYVTDNPGRTDLDDMANDRHAERDHTLNYTEVFFDDTEPTFTKPIIRDESRVQYSEIVPISFLKKQTTEHGHAQSKAPTLEVKQEDTGLPLYENLRQQTPNACYENVTVGENINKNNEVFLYEVTDNHNGTKERQPGLTVQAGDRVQSGNIEGQEWTFCVMCHKNNNTDEPPAEGWLPCRLLKRYKAGSIEKSRFSIPIVKEPAKPLKAPPIAKPRSPKSQPTTLELLSPTYQPGQKSSLGNIHQELEERLRRPSCETPPPPSEQVPTLSNSTDEQQEARNKAKIGTPLVANRGFNKSYPCTIKFDKNDLAILVNKHPSGWWYVNIGGLNGWTPSDNWDPVEVTPGETSPKTSPRTSPRTSPQLQRKHPVPKKRIMAATRDDAQKLQDDPKSKLNQEFWFVGKMARHESESVLIRKGQELEFLIRESVNRVGDYTLSVKFNGKVRHFPIETTQDSKYYIGKHNFKDLAGIVRYYQSKPLFYDDKKMAVMLGKPFKMSSS